MKNLMILVMFLLGICVVNPLSAEEAAEGDAPKPKKEKKVKKPKAPLTDISVTGKVTKKEKKDKKGNVKASYYITDEADMTIPLPKQKKKKNPKKLPKPGQIAPVVYDYETFVDVKVTITGKGTSKEHKGKKKITIKKIVSIDKVVE